MAKLTMKTAKELLERNLMKQEAFDELVEDGSISMGRQSKGIVSAMKNQNGVYVSPQLYFKNNSGGSKSETPEMKELRQKVYSLIEEYCEEVETKVFDESKAENNIDNDEEGYGPEDDNDDDDETNVEEFEE